MVTHLQVTFEFPPYSPRWRLERKAVISGVGVLSRSERERKGREIKSFSVFRSSIMSSLSLSHLFRQQLPSFWVSLVCVIPEQRVYNLLGVRDPFENLVKGYVPPPQKRCPRAYAHTQFQMIHASPEAHPWIPSLKHLFRRLEWKSFWRGP